MSGLNRFRQARLWIDREAFPRMKKLIRRARHTVLVQMFIWKDDRIGREMAMVLVEVADRGVRVEVSKEAVGDMFEEHVDFLGTRGDTSGVWQRFWNHPNIRIDYNTRNDHAKIFIIDDRVLLLTGMNIADEYHRDWHDTLVELRDRRFVEQYLTGGELSEPSGVVRLVMNTERRKEIRPVVRSLLESAQQSIVVEHCYLSDPQMLDLLISKSAEGVRVIVIVPGETEFHHYANMQSIARLLAPVEGRKIEVFIYPRMFHAKILLVDRERAFVGSANLMTTSLDEMGEVNVLVEGGNSSFIRKLRDVLRENILKSKPIAHPPRFQWVWKWLVWLKL